MLDDTLQNNCLYYIKWGAFFYIAFGWWSLTNRQMFENVVIPLRYQEDLDEYDHTIKSVLKGHYLYVFYLALIILAIIIIQELYDLAIYLFWTQENFHTDTEGLLDYPECMNSNELDNYIKEEELVRTKYGYKKMFDQTLKRFKLTWDASDTVGYKKRIAENGITDVTSYDPLHNPEQAWKYYFIPFHQRREGRMYNELNETRWVLDYPFYF